MMTLDHRELSAEAMPAARVQAVLDRVGFHLARGSIAHATAALEDGWASHLDELTPLPKGWALLDIHLSRIVKNDVRLLNMLEDEGIQTVRELINARNIVRFGVGDKMQRSIDALADRLREQVTD